MATTFRTPAGINLPSQVFTDPADDKVTFVTYAETPDGSRVHGSGIVVMENTNDGHFRSVGPPASTSLFIERWVRGNGASHFIPSTFEGKRLAAALVRSKINDPNAGILQESSIQVSLLQLVNLCLASASEDYEAIVSHFLTSGMELFLADNKTVDVYYGMDGPYLGSDSIGKPFRYHGLAAVYLSDQLLKVHSRAGDEMEGMWELMPTTSITGRRAYIGYFHSMNVTSPPTRWFTRDTTRTSNSGTAFSIVAVRVAYMCAYLALKIAESELSGGTRTISFASTQAQFFLDSIHSNSIDYREVWDILIALLKDPDLMVFITLGHEYGYQIVEEAERMAESRRSSPGSPESLDGLTGLILGVPHSFSMLK
jgi:hypothetical protein